MISIFREASHKTQTSDNASNYFTSPTYLPRFSLPSVMVHCSDCVMLGPLDCATVDAVQVLLSLNLTIRDGASKSAMSLATTSCTSQAIAKSTEVVEPRVLQSNGPEPPILRSSVSSCPKAQKLSNRVLKPTTSKKIQNAYKKANVRRVTTKAKANVVNSRPRRVYASPFRVRRSNTNMSVLERLKVLESDERIGEIEPIRVWCLSCEAWVALDKRNKFYIGMWEKHRNCYHLPVSQMFFGFILRCFLT